MLSGDVTTATGSPIQRARVLVLKADLSDTLATLFTDAAGHYEGEFVANVATESETPLSSSGYSITSLYPNPFNARLTSVNILYASPSNRPTVPEVEAFDVLGRRVDQSPLLAPGVYFVRLNFDGIVTRPKSLAVTAAGPVSFAAQRDRSESVSESASSRPALGKNQSGTRTETTLRVDRDGFVSKESVADLTPQSPTIVDFQLDDAPAPTADFSVAGMLQEAAPALFDASGSAGANDEGLSYHWQFGDALMGGGQKIAHVYTSAGTFDVTLTVTGDFGARSAITKQVAIATIPPPFAEDGQLTGAIDDVFGFPLADVDVSVVGSGLTGATDMVGNVTIDNVKVGVSLAVRLKKDGFATQVVKIGVPSDTSRTLYFEAAMAPRDEAVQIFDAENGFKHRARDGVMVDLPVDALVRSDGSLATGVVDLSMTPIDVADSMEVRSFPGRFEGLMPDGVSLPILSLGTADIAFEQDGEELQLAPGKTATVEIPIYTSGAAVGDTIPAWSVNETTGGWVQEGVGVVIESARSPSGLAMLTEVGHFSWWNCDFVDEDPTEAEGLCFVYECFNGVCNKRPEFCWVEGAQRGPPSKRLELAPPVFTVREFWPADGSTFLLPASNTYTIRGSLLKGGVYLQGDTTFFAESGQTLALELVLDTVETATNLTLPVSVTGTLTDQNDTDLYSFRGTAGQVIGFEGRGIPGPIPGNVELRDPAGNLLDTESLISEASIQSLPVDGIYSVLISTTSTTPRDYGLRIYPVSGTLAINSNTTLALSPGDFRLFRFDGTAGQTLNVGVEEETRSFKDRVLVVNSQRTFGTSNTVNSQSQAETGDFVTEEDTYYLLVDANRNGDGNVTFGLVENSPSNVTTMTLDGFGGAEADGVLEYHGSRQIFEFDASAPDAIELSLHTGPVPRARDVQITILDPNSNRLRVNGQTGWNDDLYIGYPTDIPLTGTYRLIVDDRVHSSRGSFSIRVRTVSPSAAIIVDDDLACPGAITTSVTAALRAVEENGTVTICDGLFEAPTRPELNKNGVSLTGESEEGVILRFVDINRSPGSVIDVQGVGVSVQNLTLETVSGTGVQGNNGIFTSPSFGTTALFDHITIRPFGDGTSMGPAITGDYDDVTIRNMTYDKGLFNSHSLDVDAINSIVLEDSEFNSPIFLRGRPQDNTTITVSRLTLSEFAQTVENAGSILIENSAIAGALIVRNAAQATVRNNSILRTGTSGGDGITMNRVTAGLIEGNEVNRRVQLQAIDDETITVNGNRLISENNVETLFLSAHHNIVGGTIVFQNNLISATRTFNGGLKISNAELFGELMFANNTLVHEQFGNSVPTTPTINVSLRDPAFTGALPVTFVNNVFVGDNTTVFMLAAGTTVDADYNLYHNYDAVFSTGSTSTGANDLFGSDPLLANGDYELLSGSPALDSGATPAQYPRIPSVDFDGAARPQGSGYDRGAHEGFVTGQFGARINR